jgi:hypothetical protein
MQTLAAARAKFVNFMKFVKIAKIARAGRSNCRRLGRPEAETRRGGLLLIDQSNDSHGGL